MNTDVYDLLKTVYGMSHRSASIIACKADGLSADEIAKKLTVSRKIIENDTQAARLKVGAATIENMFYQIGQKAG